MSASDKGGDKFDKLRRFLEEQGESDRESEENEPREAIVDGKPVPEIVLMIKLAQKAQRSIDEIVNDPWWQEVGIQPPPARIDGGFENEFRVILRKHGLDPSKYLDFMGALEALKHVVAK